MKIFKSENEAQIWYGRILLLNCIWVFIGVRVGLRANDTLRWQQHFKTNARLHLLLPREEEAAT